MTDGNPFSNVFTVTLILREDQSRYEVRGVWYVVGGVIYESPTVSDVVCGAVSRSAAELEKVGDAIASAEDRKKDDFDRREEKAREEEEELERIAKLKKANALARIAKVVFGETGDMKKRGEKEAQRDDNRGNLL